LIELEDNTIDFHMFPMKFMYLMKSESLKYWIVWWPLLFFVSCPFII